MPVTGTFTDFVPVSISAYFFRCRCWLPPPARIWCRCRYLHIFLGAGALPAPSRIWCRCRYLHIFLGAGAGAGHFEISAAQITVTFAKVPVPVPVPVRLNRQPRCQYRQLSQRCRFRCRCRSDSSAGTGFSIFLSRCPFFFRFYDIFLDCQCLPFFSLPTLSLKIGNIFLSQFFSWSRLARFIPSLPNLPFLPSRGLSYLHGFHR